MNTRNLKIELIDPVGIRITHIPSGLVASCDVLSSQSANKAIALRMIEQGLAELGWKWVDDAG